MRSRKTNRRSQERTLDNIEYTCNNYATYGKKAYTHHRIDATNVYNNVLADICYNAERFVDAMKNYKDVIELDAKLLNRLIKKITAGETTLGENSELQQEITIYYKFVGKFDI